MAVFHRQSVATLAWVALLACDAQSATPGDESPARPPAPSAVSDTAQERGVKSEPPPAPDPYADYPLHGLVTGTQLTIHKEPDPDALVMGWLRKGALIRLEGEPQKAPNCATGFYAIHPVGFACAGAGIEVQTEPFDVAPELSSQAQRDQALPYAYYFVKDHKVPEYHQLPSRSLQREVAKYTGRWAELEADEKHPRRLERFLAGELKNEPSPPVGVRRFLERGFFVAGTGVEVRAARRFVRTVTGTYVKEAQLLARESPSFQGVELTDERQLPIAWAVRSARPLERLDKWDGTIKWRERQDAEVIERLSRIEQWQGVENVGGRQMHVLADGQGYLRDWFVAVAERRDPPRGMGPLEPWVHVDLGEQTLVAYRGATPVYATLVASGLPDHATPTGEFQVMRKHVSDTMADIGADAENDRYRIEDVPWTQYFRGSLALHGAFWHDRFGMPRSHGCVNLSPPDALRVFEHTRPALPEGWHGVSVFKTRFTGSKVVITE